MKIVGVLLGAGVAAIMRVCSPLRYMLKNGGIVEAPLDSDANIDALGKGYGNLHCAAGLSRYCGGGVQKSRPAQSLQRPDRSRITLIGVT